jgi:pimeloyl-ACP methyl ester carboxylesterase
LQYLSKWGYRAFAIDIPSNGTKALPVTGDKEAVQWLKKLIRTLSLSNVVIISPSLSGQLTLPYIFQLKQQQQLIRGFVAIAPIGTDRFANDYYRQVNVSRERIFFV